MQGVLFRGAENFNLWQIAANSPEPYHRTFLPNRLGEHLFGRRRSQYIETFSDESRNKSDCFCVMPLQPQHDARLLVVARREYCFCHYESLSPKRAHHGCTEPSHRELRLLSDDELLHLFFVLVREAGRCKLHKVFKPHGITCRA